MLLNHDNIAIFSCPRTGTKLLAKILEQFGYYIHGEWYAIRSTEIINDKAIRRSTPVQFSGTFSENKFRIISMCERRFELFKPKIKNVITIWPEYLFEFPFMLHHLDNYHFVGIDRNPWDQILSYYISSRNFNFDGNKHSQSITIKYDAFQKMYWDYFSVQRLQDWLIAKNKGSRINFDQLISGTTKIFDQSYQISTTDEHSSLESLIVNINVVRDWFNQLELSRRKINNE